MSLCTDCIQAPVESLLRRRRKAHKSTERRVGRAARFSVFTPYFIQLSRLLPSTMSRRSPSPDSFKKHRDSNDGDTYRSRRDVARDQRGGVSDRDTRTRGYHDDNRRRRDGIGDDGYEGRGSRRRDGYDSHDDGRRRRDEGRDRRYASRHDVSAGDDDRSSRPAREKG